MSTTLTRLPRLRPCRSLEYQLVTSSRRPSMSSVSLASAEVVMPWGHHRSVASSSSFQRKPHSTAPPGHARPHGLPVQVVEHAGQADPAAEPLDGRLDVGRVLVGAPQVDARGRVRAHRSNVDGSDPPRLVP